MTEKKKIRVGVWGLGRAGNGMHAAELKKYADEFEVVACCDLLEERIKIFQEKFPEAKGYTDGNAFLADENLDLISVAVRSPQHVDYAIRALNTGRYVFQEKPIALTSAAAEKLVAAAKPGQLFFRHNRRLEPCFNHVKEIIASGILGEIFEIKLCRHSYQFRDDWQTIVSCGGGQLNNWGPHIIDHSLRLLESPVKSIWSDLKNVAALGDAEDHLKIVFKGENGRIVDMEISGGIALPSPIYAVYGTRGSLISEDEQDIKLKYLDPKQEWPTFKSRPDTPPMNYGGFPGAPKPKFIRKTIMVEPSNGLDTTDIYHMMYLAIREGKPYPITAEEALQVVKATETVKKQNPDFPIWNDEFGK